MGSESLNTPGAKACLEATLLLGKEFPDMKSIEQQLYEEYCSKLHGLGKPILPVWGDVSMLGKDAWHAVLLKCLVLLRP